MKDNNKNITPSQPIDTENLIVRMQKEDKRNKKIMKIMFFVYLACTLFYTFLFVINPYPDMSSKDRIAGLYYVLAFVIGTFYFIWEYRNYKKVDYSLPLLMILEKTEKRFRFFGVKWIPILIVVILISFGVSLSYLHYLEYWQATVCEKTLVIQAVYWAIMFISGFIGYLIWRKRSRPIWKDAKTLLEELKN